MKTSLRCAGPLAALAVLASIATSSTAAVAQNIEPQAPSPIQQRGSLGPPFQGVVKDLEVIGPNRFVMTIGDRPDVAGSDRVVVYSPEFGPVGQAFAPAEGTVYDTEPAHDGGVWTLYHSADEATEPGVRAGGMRLQLLDREGRPVGASRLVTQSLFTDTNVLNEPRRGWIITFPGGAVAVAFAAPAASTRRQQLRLTTFRPDGQEGATDVLEASLDHLPSVSTRPTAAGGALLAWGSGDPMGERLYVTRLEPDGQWADLARRVWQSSDDRARTFDVRLLPMSGSDEVAAVFTLGNDQVVRRFDRHGFGKAGIEVLNSTGTLMEPVRLDDGRLVGLAGGSRGPSGLYVSGIGEPALLQLESLDARITAFVEESQDSVVVAAVVPAASGAAVEGPNFSYLYRIRR